MELQLAQLRVDELAERLLVRARGFRSVIITSSQSHDATLITWVTISGGLKAPNRSVFGGVGVSTGDGRQC